MACRDIDFPYRECVGEPSQSWHNRNEKQARRMLTLSGEHHSPWIKEARRNDRDLHVQKDGRKGYVIQEWDRSAVFELIKSYANRKDLLRGSSIHADLLARGLLTNDITLSNALLSMYIKCGALMKAKELFDRLPARNVVTWNLMIAGYVQQGLEAEAIICFGQMRKEGISPNTVTFIYVLKGCGNIRAVQKGEEIHAEIGRQGLLEHDIVVGTALVDMYAKCGALAKAQGVFDKLPARNVITWTVLIAGYTQHGAASKALTCYDRMQAEGLSADSGTYICTLKACASIGAVEKGKEIHKKVDKQGLLEKNIALGTSLVDMYAKCGDLANAHAVFDKLEAHDVATWTALISGYTQHGPAERALNCYDQMRDKGFFLDAVSFVSILKACGSLRAAEKGHEIHAEISKQGLLEGDIVLGNALVDMYASCGMLEKAQRVLNQLPVRDATSWTSLIDGYVRHGLGDEALVCFGQMKDEGLSPNAVTFICTLKACGSVGSLVEGEELHSEVDRHGGLFGKDIILGTALVDMYCKCGALEKAQEVFDKLAMRNVATWTALMAGYSQVGEVRRVLDMFTKMLQEGLSPNSITFVVLLTACSHVGLVEDGQRLFITMVTLYKILPRIEHQTCMVDMFSRAGHSDGALCIIGKVSPSEHPLLLSALLGGCRVWANLELGKWVLENAVQLNKEFVAAYVSMRIMYASAGMQVDADDG